MADMNRAAIQASCFGRSGDSCAAQGGIRVDLCVTHKTRISYSRAISASLSSLANVKAERWVSGCFRGRAAISGRGLWSRSHSFGGFSADGFDRLG